MKYELQNLIQGKSRLGKTSTIQSIASHLRASKKTSSGNEGKEYTKQQEEESLISFVETNSLWYTGIISEFSKIGEGAEQSVYYNSKRNIVVKTNDSIFYKYWEDYFNNLILHNYFFPDTSYTFLGFRINDHRLFAVVEQPYIRRTEEIDLDEVKQFLEANGFENTRRNDYYNKDLGIILEDLHDENVISSNDIPFFIDTVFYITDSFFDEE